jgi:malto-oligosyltrehalose trehalohydrolase
VPNADGTTRFRLWAPAAQQVQLEIEGTLPVTMTALPDGWHECLVPCQTSARYMFRLQNGMAVPDPASRFQPADVHGPSEVVDAVAFQWRHPDWPGRPWHEAVIYELHPGLAGGFAGITERLQALCELGITAIELMPIADFPGPRNWGYDGVLPFAPDSAYGTPTALKTLIDTAHGLGLMVLLDVVYNHFGPDGNYLHLYAPGFFCEGAATPWGPAIDFARPEVQDFFIDNALYWLTEYRFDGLRLDAVNMIKPADFLPVLAQRVRAGVGTSRHVHLIVEHGGNAAHLLDGPYDAQWSDDWHHCVHVLLTGESDGYYRDYQNANIMLARCLAEGFAYQGEASPRLGRPRGEPSEHLPPSAFVTYLQNHDQIGNRAFGERLTRLTPPDALRAATALLLLAPNIPLLFQGEEDGAETPFYFFTSFPPKLGAQVRAGRAREFASFTGFADSTPLPDPNAETTYQASRPQADPAIAKVTRAFYAQLLAVRHKYIVPRIPGLRSLSAQPLGTHAVRAVWRAADGARLTIAVNLGTNALDIDLTACFSSSRITLFESGRGAAQAVLSGTLPSYATVAFIEATGEENQT